MHSTVGEPGWPFPTVGMWSWASLRGLGTVTSIPEGLLRLGACKQAVTWIPPCVAVPFWFYMARKICFFPANAGLLFVPATHMLVNPSLEGSWNHS